MQGTTTQNIKLYLREILMNMRTGSFDLPSVSEVCEHGFCKKQTVLWTVD